MFRLIICIVISIFSTNMIFAETVLQGGISFTISQAREFSFKNIEEQIPVETFQKYKKYNKFLNLFKDITVFSDGSFAVDDRKNNICYYYSKDRTLKFVEIILNTSLPRKSVKYNTKGFLDSIVLDIGNNEQFIMNNLYLMQIKNLLHIGLVKMVTMKKENSFSQGISCNHLCLFCSVLPAPFALHARLWCFVFHQ